MVVTVGGYMSGGGGYGGGYGDEPILAFAPSMLTVAVGDTVTFVNAGGFHNARADDGSFRCAAGCDGDGAGGNGNPSSDDWTATVTFNQPGDFGYYCETHGTSVMRGMIRVRSAAVTLASEFSGAWYNAAQSGHGFLIEQFANDQIAVVWFVYSPGGTRQNWIWAQGPYQRASNSATLPAVLFENARFPPNFDTSAVTTTPWGSVTVTFSDCNTGQVQWSASLPGYGSGTLAVTRLGNLLGTTCP
jgi:plastocyanin